MGKPPTAEAQAAGRSYAVVVRCKDPRKEPEKVSELYDHLVAAKRECGERIGDLSLDAFSRFLKARVDDIKGNLSSESVDFVIGIDKGHVKFSARPTTKGRSS